MRRKLSLISTLFLLSLFSAANLYAADPIDFSTFEAIDPQITIFGPGNSSALFVEDTVKLPLLLNRNLYIPNNAVSLTFDYNLNVETGNENYFDFYFDNLSGPSDSAGGYEGVYTGTITKNVTAFAGSTLSLAFFFNFGWDDFRFDSTLEITNARIITVP